MSWGSPTYREATGHTEGLWQGLAERVCFQGLKRPGLLRVRGQTSPAKSWVGLGRGMLVQFRGAGSPGSCPSIQPPTQSAPGQAALEVEARGLGWLEASAAMESLLSLAGHSRPGMNRARRPESHPSEPEFTITSLSARNSFVKNTLALKHSLPLLQHPDPTTF